MAEGLVGATRCDGCVDVRDSASLSRFLVYLSGPVSGLDGGGERVPPCRCISPPAGLHLGDVRSRAPLGTWLEGGVGLLGRVNAAVPVVGT